MTKKQISTLKTKYVMSKHVTSDGQPRIIKEPTGTIKGWSTRVSGKQRITAKTYDGLIDKLFVFYYGADSLPTMKSLFDQAVEEKRKLKSSGTYLKYKTDYTRFITQEMGSMLIQDVTYQYLKQYTVDMVTRICPKKESFRAYKGVLNLIYNYAISNGIVEFNMATKLNNKDYYPLCDQSSINKPKAMSPQQVKGLTDIITKRILKAERANDYYATGYMFIMSTLTGMRSGELCSLKWCDIYDSRIHIHSQQIKNRLLDIYEYVPWTKNEKGISKGGRFFPITSDIRNLLDSIRSAQNNAGIQSEWVFCNSDGSWILSDTCYGKFLIRLCKSSGYMLTNNHAIRMYFNSYVLIPAGIPVTNRAKLLGHSVEVNLSNYSFADYDYCDRVLFSLENKQ